MLLVASSAWVVDRTRDSLEVVGRPLLAVPAVCALVATGVLVYDHFTRLSVLAVVLATLTLVLVVVRLAATFRENRRLFELTHAEATTEC
jgi:Flp pilus assembly protein TadB